MARRAIERCGLETELVARLRDKGVTTLSDLMTASPLLLSVCLDVSVRDAERVQQQAAATFVQHAGRSHTALELLQQRMQQHIYLATGVPPLDAAMSGGLHMGTITEISGAPGVGKTQFCIGCCVEAFTRSHPSIRHVATSSSGNGGGGGGGGTEEGDRHRRGTILYIDTEHKFDPQRMGEVAAQRFPALYSSHSGCAEMGQLLEVRKLPGPVTARRKLSSTHTCMHACNRPFSRRA